MTPKNWYWDLKLSFDAIKAILANDRHPQFPYMAARLLSSTDDSQYVFSLMTPLVFYRNFSAIRRALQHDQWQRDTLALWEATYRRYAREFQEAGVRVRRSRVLAVDPLTTTVLEQMRGARARAGMTQRELAKQLQCSQQLVSAIERGREKLTLDYLQRFSDATGCRPEVFLRSAAQEGPAQNPQKMAEEYQEFTKWMEGEHRKAFEGARANNPTRGLMEVVAYLPDSVLNARQDAWHAAPDQLLTARQTQLLTTAMEKTQIHTFGWPVGIVLDKEGWRPQVYQDGIRAVVDIPEDSQYDYWILRRDISFYLLQSLFEDMRAEGKIFFDTRIIRTAETIMRVARLYTALGRGGRERVVIKIRYIGLKGRKLASANPARHVSDRRPCFEDEAETVIREQLGKLETNLVDLVHSATGDLFQLFDGFGLDKERVVRDIVERFSKGQI